MYVQTAITVFNKRLGADRREVYFPTCIRSASFLENKSSGHSTDGAHSQSLAYKLRIPLGAKIQDGRSYVPADKFRQLDEDAAAKAWTLQTGDYVLPMATELMAPVDQKQMEALGIGRPSTYAPTVSTIIDREYVVKEGKFLRITPLGSVVTKLMEDKFPDIVDTKFTARMEKELDTVEEGKIAWKDVLREFYGGFESNLQKAEKELEGVHLKVPDEETEEVCPECGRKLVIKSGRFGRFLACPGYPECSFTMPLLIDKTHKDWSV